MGGIIVDIKVKVGTPLCQALMICLGDMTHSQIEDWFKRQDENGNLLLDVVFTINGAEANFENLLDALCDNYDKIILSQVQQVIHEKYAELMEKLNDVGKAIDNIEIDEFRQFKFKRLEE